MGVVNNNTNQNLHWSSTVAAIWWCCCEWYFHFVFVESDTRPTNQWANIITKKSAYLKLNPYPANVENMVSS